MDRFAVFFRFFSPFSITPPQVQIRMHHLCGRPYVRVFPAGTVPTRLRRRPPPQTDIRRRWQAVVVVANEKI